MGKGFQGRENRKPNFSNKSLRGGKGNRDNRRGGRGIGAKGKSKTIIEPHPRFPGTFYQQRQKSHYYSPKISPWGKQYMGKNISKWKIPQIKTRTVLHLK